MFNSLLVCVAVGIIVSVYFILKPKSEQKEAINEEMQTTEQQEKKGMLIVEEEKKSRMIEIGGFIMVTYIVSSIFSSQTNGEGLAYKMGFWLGHLATIAVIAGALVGIVYIIKDKLSFRSVMNIIWIVTGVCFFIASLAY